MTLWTVCSLLGSSNPWNSLGKNTGASGLPLPSPGVLPDPGIEPKSPELQADSLPFEPPGKPKEKLAWKKRKYSLEKGAKQAEKGFVNPE